MNTPQVKNDGKLAAEQIENWRNVLLGVIGDYALIMSDNEVQRMRDEIQKRFNSL